MHGQIITPMLTLLVTSLSQKYEKLGSACVTSLRVGWEKNHSSRENSRRTWQIFDAWKQLSKCWKACLVKFYSMLKEKEESEGHGSVWNRMIESCRFMPRSHLQVKPSHKSYVRQFLRNGVGCGYIMVVMGSLWQLQDLCGCYWMHMATFQ